MTSPTTVRLEEHELERIRRLAEHQRRTQSNVIRLALELGLQQLEDERAAELQRAKEV